MVALFVVLTFILFIVVDLFVIKAQKKKHPAFDFTPESIKHSLAMFNKNSFNIPQGVMLTKAHLWIKKLESEKIRLGIDEFLVHALGKVAFISKVVSGNTVEKGDVIFSLNTNNKSIDFRSPVKGKVTNFNNISEFVRDPYENDWCCEIMPEEKNFKISEVISVGEIVTWLKNEFTSLRNFVVQESNKTSLVGVTMYDGGNIAEGAVAYLDEESIKKFEQKFIQQ